MTKTIKDLYVLKNTLEESKKVLNTAMKVWVNISNTTIVETILSLQKDVSILSEKYDKECNYFANNEINEKIMLKVISCFSAHSMKKINDTIMIWNHNCVGIEIDEDSDEIERYNNYFEAVEVWKEDILSDLNENILYLDNEEYIYLDMGKELKEVLTNNEHDMVVM